MLPSINLITNELLSGRKQTAQLKFGKFFLFGELEEYQSFPPFEKETALSFSSGTDASVVCNNGVLFETKSTEEDLMVPLFVLRLPFSDESHILNERSHRNEQRSGKIVSSYSTEKSSVKRL